MPIPIADPINQTLIFAVPFLAGLFISLKKKKTNEIFPLALTNELKGLAILAVVFSHIGYFLFTGGKFLFPFSTLAGVGVNLFLFLSGFGLAASTCGRKQTLLNCYSRRLAKIYIPLWIFVTSFLLMDLFLLHKIYPLKTIIENLIGFFPEADIFYSLNSPLWYLTPLIFYYLIFPLIYRRSHPFLKALGLLIIGWFALLIKLPINPDVLKLYELHLWAFPLGVFFHGLINNFPSLAFLSRIKTPVRVPMMILLCLLAGYFSRYSGVGESVFKEQFISLITMGIMVTLFIIKRTEFNLLYWFGFYSFEIYLFHWPILERYDFIYRFLPAGLSTIAYLIFFLALGWFFKKIIMPGHWLKPIRGEKNF